MLPIRLAFGLAHGLPTPPRFALASRGLCLLAVCGLAQAETALCGQTPCAGLQAVYADNRLRGTPNHITLDYLVAAYSGVREAVLQQRETERVQPAFTAVVDALQQHLGAPQAGDNTPKGLARRYAAVLYRLLHGTEGSSGDPLVDGEVDAVRSAAGQAVSPLWGRNLDYTLYRPQGRHAESPAQQQFFRAMRYANSVPLLLNDGPSHGLSHAQVQQQAATAALLSHTLLANPAARQHLHTLLTALTWDYGRPEDLSALDLAGVKLDGTPETLQRRLLHQARKQGRVPRVLDSAFRSEGPHGLATWQRLRREWINWRLVPGRYRTESGLFQRLVYPVTGPYRGPAADSTAAPPFGLGLINGQPVKAYVSGHEWLAALGSPAAQQQMKVAGEHRFAGYGKAFYAPRAAEAGVGRDHLAYMRQLAANPSVPSALLGFWVRQRSSEQLYTKQSTTGVGRSLPLPRPGASIDSDWRSIDGLRALVARQQQHAQDERWEKLLPLLQRSAALSKQAQAGKLPFNESDETFLNGLDKDLQPLSARPDSPAVVDLHRSPATGQRVVIGLGLPDVVRQGSARGGRFSYHEFKLPLAEALDDASWQARLLAAPATPPATPPAPPLQEGAPR